MQSSLKLFYFWQPVDAVYALANAYHELIKDKCGNLTLCDAVNPPPPGPEVLSYIRNVSFIGELYLIVITITL